MARRKPAGGDPPFGRVPAREAAVIDRAGSEDLLQLAWDVGPLPWQVGALLVMRVGQGFDAVALADLVGERLGAVPRCRQRLVRAPFGCGRPIWIDDPDYDVRRHVRLSVCPQPGDERALLDHTCAIMAEPLPASRPLWSATLVTGLADDRAALVVVFHHVLADGIGGLAVLAGLADGAPVRPPARSGFPRPAPSRRALAADALRARCRALLCAPGLPGLLRKTWAEANPVDTVRPVSTSLNRPTGPGRRLAVVRTDLEPVRSVARAHGATVNDVVLAAIGGALRCVLSSRGQPVGPLVASIPVSARTTTDVADLGNQVGVMPVELPICQDRIDRLVRTAALTRAQKTPSRGSSGELLAVIFRALAAAGLLRWFINRQRMVSTFVTNLRGPGRRLALGGCDVLDVLPLTSIVGNVTVSFAVISYAGRLTIMIVADPERNPDLDLLTSAVQQELDGLIADPAHDDRTDID